MAVRFLLFLVLFTLPAAAQNISATLLGTVTDASGAVVANAEVTATAKDTNRTSKAMTNQLGLFQFPYLQPGQYTVTITATGFKTMMRENISLQVDATVRTDFKLEVGDVSTTVSVTAETPLVESETGAIGQVISERAVQDIPIQGRNVFDLVALSAGVQINPRAIGGVVSTGSSLGANTAPTFVFSDFSINGGRFRTNEFLLDGVTVMLPENNNFAVSPTPDGTLEFKVMTNSYGPQFGRTGGGVVNVVTRGGSNEFHGTVYEFFRNDRLRANNFFANARNQPRGIFHFNMFGAAAGGRIVRDRTFFFAEYQGHREDNSFGGQSRTIPTMEQRRGDFTDTRLANGNVITIYDPLTTRPGTTTAFTRSPFPGNRIPASQIDPVAAALLSYLPAPNLPGTGPVRVDNWAFAPVNSVDSNQWSARIDHRFSDKHFLFGRLTRNTGKSNNTGEYRTFADNTQGPIDNHALNGVLNGTYTVTPTLILNYRYGATRRLELRDPLWRGQVKIADLKFPQSYANAFDAANAYFPETSMAGYSNIGSPAGDLIRRGNDIHTTVIETTKIAGRHTWKFGADLRLYNQTPLQGYPVAHSYTFARNFTQGPNPQVVSLGAGDGVASLLTGYGSGSIRTTQALAVRNLYYALFVNDDIKLGRLTINTGLRWDVEGAPTERYDRFVNFAFDEPLPLQVPTLTNLRGVLVAAGRDGNPRGQIENTYQRFGPRIGLAYRATNTMAIRAGYGVFFAPRKGWTSANNYGISGADLNTSWVASLDGVTPLNPLNNPYPDGVLLPRTLPAERLLVGEALSVNLRNNRANSYMQHWNFGIQRGFSGNLVVEAAYAGSQGTHLPVALVFNQVNPIYQALGNDLIRQVNNPFFGLVRTGGYSNRTFALSNLLKPFPQYGNVSTSEQNATSSKYHALQLRAEKRFSGGYNVLLNYTASKQIDNGAGRVFGFTAFLPPVQDAYNLRAERSLSTQDVSQRLVISHTYQLPFGRGKALLASASPAVNRIVTGWSLSGLLSLNTGFPLELTSPGNTGVSNSVTRPNNNGRSAKKTGPVQSRLTEFFDTSVFSVPAPFTFGNTSRGLPDVRGPGRRNYDLALNKATPVTERVNVVFRVEAFNLTNTPYFNPPGTTLAAGGFGVISTAIGERQIQFSLKIQF